MKFCDYYLGVLCNGNSFICIVLVNNVVEVGILFVKKMLSKDF